MYQPCRQSQDGDIDKNLQAAYEYSKIQIITSYVLS